MAKEKINTAQMVIRFILMLISKQQCLEMRETIPRRRRKIQCQERE